jgi:hypothetical protein
VWLGAERASRSHGAIDEAGETMHGDRVSPRQAVIVAPLSTAALAGTCLAAEAPSGDLVGLLRVTLMDVIGALVRVDGVTLAIIGPTSSDDIEVYSELPAGIEVIDPGVGQGGLVRTGRLVPAAIGALLDRQFDRVVALAGDVLRLAPRIVATGLSALGEAEVVVGPTKGGHGYLVGVRDQPGRELLFEPEGGAPFGGAPLVALAQGRRRVVRRLEVLPRLIELADLAAVRAAVQQEPTRTPRLASLIGASERPA